MNSATRSRPTPTPATPPARRGPRRSARTSVYGSVGTHAVLIIGAFFMVFPFAWQFLTALKTQSEAIAVPVQFLPSQWQWSVFTEIFDLLPFAEQLRTSVIVAFVRTAGQVLLCSLAAYAFARLHFRGRELCFALFLSVLMVPSQLLILPQYELMSSLGLLNTIPALILPGLFSAFGTFLLRQFFLTIPMELEEAALLDGASRLRIYWNVMLPLVRPALAALAVITMMNSWNDLLWPLVVNTDPSVMPISAGLTTLQGQFTTNYPVLMGGALLASLPMLAAFLLLQRHFIQGIALTGSKG